MSDNTAQSHAGSQRPLVPLSTNFQTHDSANDHEVVQIDLDTMTVIKHTNKHAPQTALGAEIERLESNTDKPNFSNIPVDVTSDSKLAISWKNIEYKVKEKKKNPETNDYDYKTILHDLNGVVNSGEVLAIMGPSGCGKTTLLDLLANRIGTGSLQGQVKINGRLRTSTFKHYAAYVQQEDTLFGTMTVRETFEFIAKLTRGENSTDQMERERVDHIIKMMGLQVCENVRIGNVFFKGISGGQKRRVSLGLELFKNPSIMFLDEPTSGLDSASAFGIMEYLNVLAKGGMTILCTIHQPSSEVFQSFSKLLLLSKGQTVYFGSAASSVNYFAGRGFPAPQYSNPADYFMTLINSDFGETSIGSKVAQTNFPALYKASNYHVATVQAIDNINKSARDKNIENKGISHAGFSINEFRQFMILAQRRMIDNIRNPGIYWVRAFMFVMLCLMIGSMHWQLGTEAGDIQDRISLLFFAAAFLVFMSIAVVPFFIEDRAIFTRERANGYYHVAAHVLADSVVTIPGLLLISLVCSIILYFMAGLSHGGEGFVVFLFALFMSLYVAESMLALVSSLVPHYIIGMALGAGLYGMFMLCEGFFVIPSNIPPWWKYWGYYMGFHTYSFRIFMYNEFRDSDWGKSTIERFELENTDIDLDFGVLVIMAVIYRFVYFLVMQYIRTGKR